MNQEKIYQIKGMLLDEETDMFTNVFCIDTTQWEPDNYESFFKVELVMKWARVLRQIKDTSLLHIMCLRKAEPSEALPHVDCYTWFIQPTVRVWVVEVISSFS